MRKRKGFTLVELLVVVGIIAVLIGILMPSLSRAREHANRIRCMANLRQLATAMSMYNNDNKGRYPASGTSTWVDNWIYWETDVAPLVTTPRNPDEGVLVPYMGGHFISEAYRCPSDRIDNHKTGSFGTYRFSYTVNNWICFRSATDPDPADPDYYEKRYLAKLSVTQIKKPWQKILFVDESPETVDDGCWNWNSYYTDSANMLSTVHDRINEKTSNSDTTTAVKFGGRGNVVFVDTHCESLYRNDIFKNFKTMGYYCRPLFVEK